MKIINLERIRQLLDGLPANIVQSEEQGQYELVNSTQLPTDIDAKDKASLEAAGVRFGEPSPDDPLFCDAELPEGWKVEKTDHPLWSNLVDAEGQKRAEILYKAAFYDRKAFIQCI